MKHLSLCLLSLICLPAIVHGDDEDWKPGLLATYRNGERQVSRIEPLTAFSSHAAQPIEGMGVEGYTVAWQGHLLVRDDKVRLHMWLQGDVEVRIGDTVRFAAASKEPAWVSSDELQLEYGFQPLHVRLAPNGQHAEFKLYWSADAFPLEPVPAHQLFHESAGSEVDPDIWTNGRKLFVAYRCDRCHAVDDEALSHPAPALWGVTLGLSPEWLTEKLLTKHAEANSSNMPNFGFDESEADAIAAYLIRLGSPSSLVSVPAVKEDKKNPPPTGVELLNGSGCLGCHRVGELGTSGPFAGPDLSRIGGKRSPEWLATWLFRPERINPQHQMPLFKFTPTERGQLVSELTGLGHQDGVQFIDESTQQHPADVIDKGRDLVKQFRCANCHKIPAIEADRRGYSTLREAPQLPSGGCLGETVDKSRHQPIFSESSRAALRVYVKSLRGAESIPLAEFERGRRVIEERNCLGCHARDGAPGIAPVAVMAANRTEQLKGHPVDLIPPNLTAIGDKLLDAGLLKSVSGEQDRLRQDWLRIQMPKFAHTEVDRKALLSFLTGQDRVPENPPDPRFTSGMQALAGIEANPDAAPPAAILGRQLIGAGGFSCIACHQVGDYRPRNVAQGARGSDLKQSHGRLRPEFYFRWTRAPLRIVPGMEMPSYVKAVPHVLDEDLPAQLAMVWKALQDPQFQAPTNPAQMEQFLVVDPASPPRIVRDVFELPQQSGYVARSFAVGLSNGHSLLFDIDTAQIRQWTYGDFARQKAEGKSWFWEMAGLPVPEFAGESQWQIKHDGNFVPLFGSDSPIPARVELKSYAPDPSAGSAGVTLNYDLIIAGGTEKRLRVREHWVPLGEGDSGWQRDIEVQGTGSDIELALATGQTDSQPLKPERIGDILQLHASYRTTLSGYLPVQPPNVPMTPETTPVTTLPGYDGVRLPVSGRIMPTAFAWSPAGELLFTSLKGDVYGVRDINEDGLGDDLVLIDSGLSAPFGLLADGDDLLVTHKPEVVRLKQVFANGKLSGAALERETVWSGWGFSPDYHDWVTGPVRDSAGNLYLGLGSDYSQSSRPQDRQQWRGTILRIAPGGQPEPIARELRYPIGIALDAHDRLFVTDQQGVQNTYNELDYIVPGLRYGVPSQEDLRGELSGFEGQPAGELDIKTPAAVHIPHPWTRSVNGLFFLPADGAFANHPFAGHAIGCEYNGKFLVRCSLQEVAGTLQGAAYPFSRVPSPEEKQSFLGPMCGGVAPNGDIYVGSIYDSGWLGGLNVGEIVRLRRNTSPLPNGIREIRLTKEGFELEFVHPVDAVQANDPKFISLTAATRNWSGSYATEDAQQHVPETTARSLSADGRTLQLTVPELRTRFVYEFQLGSKAAEEFFPAWGAYTLNALIP